MSPKDVAELANSADPLANSADPDQTAPLGAVWSGSTLFAQTCLSENVGIMVISASHIESLLTFLSLVIQMLSTRKQNNFLEIFCKCLY